MRRIKLTREDLIVAAAVATVLAWAILTARGARADAVNYHHARAAIAIAYHLTEDAPDSDICPACNGAGEVGDGRIVVKCADCDGTGKRKTGTKPERNRKPADEYEAQRRRIRLEQYEQEQAAGEIIEPPDEPEPVIQLPPVAEPIRIEWATTEAPAAVARLPRVLMLTDTACGPCRRVKAESGDMIGDGPDAAIESVDVTIRPQYPTEYGIRRAGSIPTFVVLGADGRERARMTGYMARASLASMLTRYQIPQTVTVAEDSVTATISGPPSVAAATQALALHLGRTKDMAAVPVGGLFDRDVKAPVIVPELLRQLMAGDVVKIEDAGLVVSWIGATRSIVLESSEHVVFQPPATVKLTKWGLTVGTTLSGVDVTDSGRTIRFNLKGPDFTVHFTP